MSSPSTAIPMASPAKAPSDATSPSPSVPGSPSVTIVSAADAGYFWGLFLLAASNARSGMGFPMNLLTKGSESHCLGQLRMKPEVHRQKVEETIRYARKRRIKVNVYLEVHLVKVLI